MTNKTDKPLTFEEWCGLNARRHIGARSYTEFKANCEGYESYLANEAADEAESAKQTVEEYMQDSSGGSRED